MSSGIWQSRSTVLYCRCCFWVQLFKTHCGILACHCTVCAPHYSPTNECRVFQQSQCRIGSWHEVMHYSCFFQNRMYLCVCVCMCVCACTPFLYALFLQMYKTSFWGVLTCFVDLVLELLPFLHSHLHFPAQAYGVLVCYAVSRHKPAATYLHSIRGLQIFVTLGFYNILALFMWLTSAFVQSICHVKLFALLRFMQCTMMVLCVAVSILLWQEKMGLLTRFLRPYFAHSHLHGLLCIPCFLDDGSLGIDSAPGWP